MSLMASIRCAQRKSTHWLHVTRSNQSTVLNIFNSALIKIQLQHRMLSNSTNLKLAGWHEESNALGSLGKGSNRTFSSEADPSFKSRT